MPKLLSGENAVKSAFQVRWVNSEADIPAELWDRCFPPSVEGRWWYQALEYCGIQDQFTFLYAIVSDASGPVAIAPAFLMDVPIRLVLPPAILPLANLIGRVFPSALYQRTFFIGSPCSDEGMVGILPGTQAQAVYRCLNLAMQAQAKKSNAPMRVWKDFPPAEHKALLAVAESAGLFPLVSYPGTIVHFKGASKDDYFASLKSSRRHALKKKLKASANIPVDIEILHQPDTGTLDELFELFWQTYEKGETKFERLNRKFFDLVASQPCAYFVTLRERVTGKIVAFMLCFLLEGKAINKFLGFDYQRPKEWFLYFRVWEAAVEWALSQGASSLQSGQTGYDAKLKIGHELVALTNYCAHANPIVHWIYAAVAKTVNWDTLDEDLAVYLKAYPELRPTLKSAEVLPITDQGH